ncbi:hypothetical protein ACQ4LE_001566 [Meloidogyne hapla]
MSDFDPKYFTKEEHKQFAPILDRLRKFEESVAHSLRKINQKVEELSEKETQTKNSLTATKGSITKLSNKIWEKIKEMERNLTQNDLEVEDFQDTVEEPEINVSDPFLNNGVYVGNFDGNPTVSFSKWIDKFMDVLSLVTTELTEPQKILRLRFCLSGQARVALDTMQPQPETLALAIAHLKGKFENGNTKVIARQKLSNCRQAPGESVFDFANRLSDLVRTALVGETENTIKNTLLYEFLDKMSPDLKFQVKSQRPTEYTDAYELALHFELLLAEKKPATSINVSKLADEVESLVLQRNNSKTCFNCKSPSHLANSCPKRRNDNNYQRNNSFGYRPNYNRGNDNRYNNRDRHDYGRPNRDRAYNNDGNRYSDNRSNHYYSEKRSHNNYRNNYPDSRSPSRERNNYKYSNKYTDSRSPSRERNTYRPEKSNRSPRRVRFERRGSPSVRVVSPYFVVLMALICCFFNPILSAPMICLKDAPVSLWRLPNDPICPKFHVNESPIPIDLSIYRANTLQYKTPAFVCKCVKTIVSKSRGFFGGYMQETETLDLNVPISECKRMRALNQSRAGYLKGKNGTLKGTDNNSDMDWKIWPVGIPWDTKETENCYIYETVVFTHHGMEGINTPVGSCPGCLYHSGTCKCDQGSLIWNPDKTHQCSYIFVNQWPGEFASGVWLSESNEFALSFENTTKIIDCDKKELILSDQGFAIPLNEYNQIQNVKEFFENKPPRKLKREINEVNNGLVYSSQLASQITALSASFTKTIKRIFSDSVRQICTDLQEIADQLMTLAAASPTASLILK